jgi:formylglycine-generating enzyme required for sulfatase activity
MSDFYKKFLLEDPRRLSAGGRCLALAAFGKHPGWDDHVEDLGLETESLNLAKTFLYVNGIGGQIDSGAWEKLDEAQQLPAFRHLFVWQRSGQFLIGRLWSSSDGKGRKRYPMVVCLHFIGVTLGWALKQALPALAELEAGCVRSTSAEEVRGLLNQKRAALREIIQSTDGRGEYAPVTPESLHKILHPAGDPVSEGFLRVLYQMQGQLGSFGPGSSNGRAHPAAIRAQQLRVPAAAENPEQTLLFWTRFFQTQTDPAAPLLLTLPLDAGWLDVTVGEPESHEFFCLRASPKAVPLVSEVPYKLDDTFRAKATAFLGGFERGDTKGADLKPAPAQAIEAPPGGTGRWRKWLGVGSVIVLGAVAAVIWLPKGGKPAPQNTAPETKPQAAKSGALTQGSPPAADAAQADAARAKERAAANAEAARLAEANKKAEADALAAKKAKAEAIAKEKERQAAEAADKEKERQMAEAARITREKAAAAQKQEQQRLALAAEKKKADTQASANLQLAAVPTPTPTVAGPVTPAAPLSAQGSNELTNTIGMVLIRVNKDLQAGKFEVTQAEYKKVMGDASNPSKSLNDKQPVERVTWNDAVKFTRKLTEMERDKLPPGTAYSLPTEKQWKEFLGGQKFEDLPARGMTGKGEPAAVGQSGPPNKFGLFDVLGNVWEWCLDGATGEEKLLKGGAFNSANYDRTLLPDRQVSNCGFRCVLAAQ